MPPKELINAYESAKTAYMEEINRKFEKNIEYPEKLNEIKQMEIQEKIEKALGETKALLVWTDAMIRSWSWPVKVSLYVKWPNN